MVKMEEQQTNLLLNHLYIVAVITILVLNHYSLIAKDGYQRMLMTQQQFKVTANGFVELNGSITVQLSKDTVFGVNPGIAQNYNPFSGNGKTRRRQLFKIEHKLPVAFILFRYMQWHLFNFLQQHPTMLNGQMKL